MALWHVSQQTENWFYDDMIENIFFLLKRKQNWTTTKEIIKVLFVYTMIHKLDLYINIAFHPNDQKYYTFN